MIRSYSALFLVALIAISLTVILSVSFGVLEVKKKSHLIDSSGEASILSVKKYKQRIRKINTVYDWKAEPEHRKVKQTKYKIKNFPVLIGNDVENNTLEQKFYTARYFSKLPKQNKFVSSNTPIVTNSLTKTDLTLANKIKTKIIKISNLPVRGGYLSSSFGMRRDPFHRSRRMHKGIDIAARAGTVVKPLGKGVVYFAGKKPGYGNIVEIQHGKTVFTRYAHLQEFSVYTGQQVNNDDQIGLIGSTGRSTGPHLHLEVLFNGKQVDPMVYLSNHYGSKTRKYRAIKTKLPSTFVQSSATITSVSTSENRTIEETTLKINQEISFPEIDTLPDITYQDYVNTVDGLYGFTAPE